MKITSKQLTFFYFSIVSMIIIVIHASVFISTSEDMERLYAEHRLDKIREYLLDALDNHQLEKKPEILLQTQGKAKFDPFVKVIFEHSKLPKGLIIPDDLRNGVAFEATDSVTNKTYFLVKHHMGHSYGEAYLLLDNSFYEMIEEHLPTSSRNQLLISISLLIISLFIVFKLSTKLTKPISDVAEVLAHRQSDNLEPIRHPEGLVSSEIHQLILSLNAFQERINQLLERERAFNRYASHELRTPLTVIKGIINLLEESKEPEFVEKQRLRLKKVTLEMQEFIQTLLSLTKVQSENSQCLNEIIEEDIQSIIDHHLYLLNSKNVKVHVDVNNSLTIPMPKAAFNILLGNLIKNAFAGTAEGQITIQVAKQEILIKDTGLGLQNKQSNQEGFGLGLLLVRDICKKYACTFSLQDNADEGCTAKIQFPNEE